MSVRLIPSIAAVAALVALTSIGPAIAREHNNTKDRAMEAVGNSGGSSDLCSATPGISGTICPNAAPVEKMRRADSDDVTGHHVTKHRVYY
jgi:hypothetical protein